ncbi:MAG: Sir2 family NAD-dependent protein deacetylase [Desulfohalobiaceae bacterium]
MQQERDLQSRIRILARQIYESRYPVFFTGAGISTESGISDYRGPDGVWTRQEKGLPPDPSSLPLDQAEPNPGHMSLKELQDLGKLAYLVIVNKQDTPLDSMASLRFSEPIGQVLPAAVKRLKGHMGLFE